MNISLIGKRALICGGSGGIGFAAAKLIAEAGASVTLIARNQDSLKEAIKNLKLDNNSQQHEYLAIDLSDPYLAAERINDYIADGNSIDILVNNSGGPAPGLLLDEKPEKFLATFNQHIISAQLITQLIVPHMKKNKWGRIINVISSSVKTPIQGLGVSNTIRGAMASWSKTMATELAAYGITVNNVLPGSIDTQRIASIIANESKISGKSESEIKAEKESRIPMRRIGRPEEIAAGVLFLASEQASYITGINLPVDGGSTPCL